MIPYDSDILVQALNRLLTSGFLLLAFIAVWTRILSRPSQAARAGGLLLSLRIRQPRSIYVLAAGGVLIPSILTLLLWPPTLFSIAQLAVGASVALYSILLGESLLEVREKGLFHLTGFAPWQRISAFRWYEDSGRRYSLLSLRLTEVLPRELQFLRFILSEGISLFYKEHLELAVPTTRKDQLAALLERNQIAAEQ